MAEYIKSGRPRKTYINFKMDRSMYCTYSEDCRIDEVIHKDGICNFCIWKKKIDIPKTLEGMRNE